MKHQYEKTLHSVEVLYKPLDMSTHDTLSTFSLPTNTTMSKANVLHGASLVQMLSQRTKPVVKPKAEMAPKPSRTQTQKKPLRTQTKHMRTKHLSRPTVPPVEELPAVDMQQIPMLAKCVSFIMKKGHKAKATSIMNNVFRMLQELSPQNKTITHVLDMLHEAINNVKPAFELRKARFGGRTQFIPATMKVHKQENSALRAIMHNARTKHKKVSSMNKHVDMYTFAYFLAQEFHDAYKHQGAACQAKHTTHKQAEHNRNNVRRRWW